MISAACIGVALLVAAVAGAPAEAPAAGADADERFAAALADLKARRYHEAALAFEALWARGRSTNVLLYAAQAREGAGHWAHAIVHLRTLLAEEPAMDPRQRARLSTRLTAAVERTRPLQVRLSATTGSGGPVRGAVVELRRVAPDELRPVLELPCDDGSRFDVEPGVWSLTVRAPAHAPLQRVLAVAPRPRRGEVPAEEVVFALEELRVATTLVLGPAAAVGAGARWTLRPAGEEGGALQLIGGAQAREDLSLAPGRWTASVEAPGYVAQEITWVAGEEVPPEVTLVALPPVVEPAPPPVKAAPDPGLGLGLGLGLAGAASAGVGIGLLVQHRVAYAHFERAPDNAAFVAALTASEAGAGMLGAGVGLAVAAVSAGVPVRPGAGGVRSDARSGLKNRDLWIEVGVGGGVALIGAAWYAREWPRVQRDLYGQSGSEMPDVKTQHRETAAAAILGAGVGLATGAGVALLTRALVRKLRRAGKVGLGAGPGLVGLGVRGRF